jgi:hypothetical protein
LALLSNIVLSKRSVLLKIFKLINNEKTILWLWISLALFVSFKQYFQAVPNNNYLIFKYTYLHAVDHLNLYKLYSHQYFDSNHYGPFFSLLIAPFALLPDYFGMLFWQLANILFLYFAIKQLPLNKAKIPIVYWIITHELLTAMFALQFNISIAAIIIFAFVFIEREKNFWAAFVIVLGTFVKLYGIVGLAFFFFAKQKPKFILYCIFWSIVFFVAPMVLFTPQYILQCYADWYHSLAEKQLQNASLTSMQDISIMGMVRRITGNAQISNLPFLAIGIVLFSIPYLRIKQYAAPIFRLLFLASTLIFAVIFSNSSESPTYIIAFCGVAIWFVVQENPKNYWVIALFIFALLLTSFSPSDLFPKFVRENYIKPYSLKALPCILIWGVVIYQLIFTKFHLKQIKLSNE